MKNRNTASIAERRDEVELLVRRCLEGDEYAWELMYRRYVPTVRQAIAACPWRFTSEQREDLVQDIFLRIVRFLRRYSFRSTLSTWIYRIARNRSFDQMRDLFQRIKEIPLTIDPEEEGACYIGNLVATRNDPEASILSRERLVQAQKAMARLPAADRELILAKATDKAAFHAAVRRLGLSPGHAAVKTHRIIRKLAKMVKAQ